MLILTTQAADPILSITTPNDLRQQIARQLIATSRPTPQIADTEGFLRFDGKDDFLLLPSSNKTATELTLFILAAPRSNAGYFRGLFAAAPNGANDYSAGFNIDLGPNSTTNLSVINVESAGSIGAQDLLQQGFVQSGRYPFGGFHVFTVRNKPGPKGTELFINGLLTGARDRAEAQIRMDHFTIGARLYSNDPGQPPFVQGNFDGDITAVILYDKALADPERDKIEQQLLARVATLNAIATGEHGHALETVANPPIIQMLAPGFTVHELPLKLSNINNVRYRHDGKLVALGYDGRIHLLTDTDGDGLEDKAEPFWNTNSMRSPLGMALINDARGDGVVVPNKGKVSLILDRNRDGRADEEIVIATGWKQITHQIDALGVAIDPRDQSIYFAIGNENFIDPYLHDGKGNTLYKTTDERGTIQRISADFTKRETVATGVRFICGLAFNKAGDLFATDQEGATWVPNGNPLDELLHIVPGRHYGFPPRHPKNLPNVIDEPAIVEYGPQHQSTVGLIFNEGVNGGPHFGPAHWQGDALVTGESRGKLYRTKLVKTDYGYVGQNHLIACLGLLTVDSCVTPQGDLIVACHSGPPDWGTGPTGEGRLFKIRYTNKTAPQITAAWAAAPDEFRIAFDKPLNPSDWSGAREKIRIEAGKHVSAGDRFETIRPGYQIVRDQMSAPRRWVNVQTLQLTADQRTMILRIPRQTEQTHYAVTLPTPKSWIPSGGIEQKSEFDLLITLNGTVAEDGAKSIVIPHPDVKVARILTEGSADHERFFKDSHEVVTPRLTYYSENIFVPEIQPGSTLDWEIQRDDFANRRMEIGPDATYWSLEGTGDIPLKPFFAWPSFVMGDTRRPIPINRVFLPWGALPKEIPNLLSNRTDVKGNWLHGRRLFFGGAACGTCHTIRGEGAAFGPDLSNLVFRDRASVLHDITQPSTSINPDHLGSRITFKDGNEQDAIIKSMTDARVFYRVSGGVETDRPRSMIASIEPLKRSLMPDGFGQSINADQMEDLLTFLLTNPLEPTKITRQDPPIPPARTPEELVPFRPVDSIAERKPIRILLCAGPKDHGLDEHDYPLWLNRWSKLLALADNITVATNMGFPSAAQLANADVTVFFSANPGWNTETAKLLDDYQKRGGGLVYLHYGVEGGQDHLALADKIGLAFYASAFRHGDMDLQFTDIQHPITQGFKNLKFVDETYWAMKGDPNRIHALATSLEDKQPRPQLWTLEREKGRVFVCIPGHYMWTFDDPLYRILVLRGICWTAREPDVNRLNELATIGARLAP